MTEQQDRTPDPSLPDAESAAGAGGAGDVTGEATGSATVGSLGDTGDTSASATGGAGTGRSGSPRGGGSSGDRGAGADDPTGTNTGGPGSNPEKDPADWVTGDEPMTGPQRSYLQTLSREAGEPFDEGLSKAQASQRIDELQERTGRGASGGGSGG